MKSLPFWLWGAFVLGWVSGIFLTVIPSGTIHWLFIGGVVVLFGVYSSIARRFLGGKKDDT